MKLILLCIILLAFVLAYYIYPIFKAIQMSIEIEENTVAYEQHPENPSMRILVAGDSAGVGTGAENSEDSIAGRIGRDYPKADITNISENGITLEQLKSKLYALPESKYGLILLQIGANDATRFTSKEKVEKELALVLNYAELHSPSVIVVTAGNIGLSPVFKSPLSNLITSRTLMVREIFIREISERPGVQYVDLFESAENDIFSTDIDRYYAPDLFHPSGAGYGVWYEDIKKYLD